MGCALGNAANRSLREVFRRDAKPRSLTPSTAVINA